MDAISGAKNSPFAHLKKTTGGSSKLKVEFEGVNNRAIQVAFGLDKKHPNTLLQAMRAICSDAGEPFKSLPSNPTSAHDLIMVIGQAVHEAQKNQSFNDAHWQVAQNMYALLKAARTLFGDTHEVFRGFKRDQRGHYDPSSVYLNEGRTKSSHKRDDQFNQTAWTSYFKDVLAFQETVATFNQTGWISYFHYVLAFLEPLTPKRTTNWDVLGKDVTPEESLKILVRLGVCAKGQPVTREDVDTHWESTADGSDTDEIKQLKSTIQFVKTACQTKGASSGGSSAPVVSPGGSGSSSMAMSSGSVISAQHGDGTHGIKTFTQPDKTLASNRLEDEGKNYVPRGKSEDIRTSVRGLYDEVDSGKARMKNEFEKGFYYSLSGDSADYRTSEAPELKKVSEDDMHLDSKEVYVDFKGLEGLIGQNFKNQTPDTKLVVEHLMIVKKDGRLPNRFRVPGKFSKVDYYRFLEKAASYVTTIVTAPKLFDVVGDRNNPQLRVCDSLIPYHLIATPFPRFQKMRNGSKTPDHEYFIESDGTIKKAKKDELKQRFQRVFDMMCWPAQKKGMDLSMPMPSDFFSSLNPTTKTEMQKMIVDCIKELSQKYPGVRLYINPIGFSDDLKKELKDFTNVVVHDKDITEPHRLRQDGEKEVLIATMPHPTHAVGNGAFSDRGGAATEENLSGSFPTYIEASKRDVNPYVHVISTDPEKYPLTKNSEEINDVGDKRHIQDFLRSPTYKNNEISKGMLFLAQHLPPDDFKQCIDFVLTDNIWLDDDELDETQKAARDQFKKELQSFKNKAFIDELKKVDINKGDLYEHYASQTLLDHFKLYQGNGPGLCYLKAFDSVSNLQDFIKKINSS